MIIRSNSSGIHELQSAQTIDFEGCFQHPPAGGVKHPSRVAENGTRLKVCEKKFFVQTQGYSGFSRCVWIMTSCLNNISRQGSIRFFLGPYDLMKYCTYSRGKGCFGRFPQPTPSHSMALPQLVAPNIVSKPCRSDHRLNMDKNGLGFVQHSICDE